MVTDKIKELEKLTARAAELQAAIELERTSELAALPAKFGYDSLNTFIKALKAAYGKGAKKSAKKASAPKAEKKRSRAKITPELKEQVKAMVEAGEPGAKIAETLGISVPSVQNIKKELGLVKARSTEAAPAPEAAPQA